VLSFGFVACGNTPVATPSTEIEAASTVVPPVVNTAVNTVVHEYYHDYEYEATQDIYDIPCIDDDEIYYAEAKCEEEDIDKPRRPMLALTFDDGPSRYTEGILDALEEHGGRATFFVLGYRVENWADTVQRTVDVGSEVAGHSWDHANFFNLSNDAMRRQLYNTSAAIQAATGEPPPPFVRIPYGSVNARIRTVTRELGYSMVNWSIDPADWRIRDADIIYNHIMTHAVDGGIVLLHDIRPSTMEAVQRAVPSLIEKGFDLVTVSELLAYFFEELSPGGVYMGMR